MNRPYTKHVPRDAVKEDLAVFAECIDCKWTHQYTGTKRHRGTASLTRGRAHAHRFKHLVLVHRSTEFDGRDA